MSPFLRRERQPEGPMVEVGDMLVGVFLIVFFAAVTIAFVGLAFYKASPRSELVGKAWSGWSGDTLLISKPREFMLVRDSGRLHWYDPAEYERHYPPPSPPDTVLVDTLFVPDYLRPQ